MKRVLLQPTWILIAVVATASACQCDEVRRAAAMLVAVKARLPATAVIATVVAVPVESSAPESVEDEELAADSEAAAPVPAFAFPGDPLGALTRERLSPPQHVAVDPIPFVDRPRARNPVPAERAIEQAPAPLAPAQFAFAPRLLGDDRGAVVATLPARDVPPLVVVGNPPRPEQPLLPQPALAYASSPPVEPAPLPAARRLFDDPKPTAALDPSPAASRQLNLPLSVVERKPASFLRLTIPDPFEHLQDVQLRSPLAENDPPPSPRGLPARAELPVDAVGK